MGTGIPDGVARGAVYCPNPVYLTGGMCKPGADYSEGYLGASANGAHTTMHVTRRCSQGSDNK